MKIAKCRDGSRCVSGMEVIRAKPNEWGVRTSAVFESVDQGSGLVWLVFHGKNRLLTSPGKYGLRVVENPDHDPE